MRDFLIDDPVFFELIDHLWNGTPRKNTRPYPSTKTCTSCNQLLPIDDFHIDPFGADGHRTNCKACRSTRKQKPAKPRYIESRIWFEEAARVCGCTVCGQAPQLPDSVEGAREHLSNNLPLCEEHADTKILKVRLAQKQWHHHAQQRLFTIELFHDVTVMFKNVPRTRKPAARRWLGGERDLTNPYIAGVLYAVTQRLTDVAVQHGLPAIITPHKRDNIINHETVWADMPPQFRALWDGDDDSEDNSSDSASS